MAAIRSFDRLSASKLVIVIPVNRSHLSRSVRVQRLLTQSSTAKNREDRTKYRDSHIITTPNGTSPKIESLRETRESFPAFIAAHVSIRLLSSTSTSRFSFSSVFSDYLIHLCSASSRESPALGNSLLRGGSSVFSCLCRPKGGNTGRAAEKASAREESGAADPRWDGANECQVTERLAHARPAGGHRRRDQREFVFPGNSSCRV